MARAKRGRKRSKNFAALQFVGQLPLGTLGSVTVVKQDLTVPYEQSFHVISVDCQFSLSKFENNSSDGPIICGYNHSDYTVGEVGEALDTPVASPGNKVEQEKNRRWVRRVGSLVMPGVQDATIQSAVLNDGKPIRTKLNWTIDEDDSLEVFAFNAGSSGLTTGSTLDISGTIYGYWK